MTDMEVLSSVRFEGTDVEHAVCIRAGNWVFLNGIESWDYERGVACAVTANADLPFHGKPKLRREADVIVTHVKDLLSKAGTSFSNSVRLDQFYSTWKAVDPYHLARKAAFGDYIPPSTSVVMDRVLGRNNHISTSVIAVLSGTSGQPKRLSVPGLSAPTGSGFAPAITSGDYLFIAGQMARGEDNSPDPRAHIPPYSRWNGSEIRRQTEYIIKEKLYRALKAGNSSPENVLKAQVYLKHTEDLPDFLEVWNAHFGERQCALTIVPTSDFDLIPGTIEINLLAVTDHAPTGKQVISVDVPRDMVFGAPGVLAGDLLLLSGMQAVDNRGPLRALKAAEDLPYLAIAERAQQIYILDQAEKVCAAAGTSLRNAVRVQQFHTRLESFYATYKIWQERFDARPMPFSAVRVPEPLPVPSCTMLVDLWVYAPQ